MEFVTIHDLSREFNIPARVIRYRLIHLIMEGKLKEQDDFRRDDFKDDQHFVWKINPLSFMRETALRPVSVVNEIDNSSAAPDTKSDNQPVSTVNQSNKIKTEPHNSVNHVGNNPPPSVNEIIQADNKEPSLEREMIDLLKEQVKIKDGQLQNQGEQLKGLNELNVSLNKAMLRQSEKIETLLQLTGGKIEVQTDEGNPVDSTRDHSGPA